MGEWEEEEKGLTEEQRGRESSWREEEGGGDAAGAGSIDKTELLMALQRMGMDVRGNEIRELMKDIDINNNELVEFEEFVELMERWGRSSLGAEGDVDGQQNTITG